MAKNIWKIRPVLIDRASENEWSRRYYQMLLQWVPYADMHFSEWNGRPNCGYFFSGSYAYGTDTSYTAAIFAALSKIGDYDPEATGLPRGKLAEKAIKGIRYLGFTHETGPVDCVRVEGKNPFYSGKKWGRNDEDFFRATQTGRSIAAFALAARFLWDDLDDETKELVQSVTSSYADRWYAEIPKSGTYNDTQEEENAWTAMGISAAMDMFPEHPNHKRWKQGFVRWSANSVTTFRDCFIQGPTLSAQTKRTQEVPLPPMRAITLHADYSTENHGFVHPVYLIAGISLRSMHVVSALAGGSDILSSALHNNEAIYERVIKVCTQRDGFVVPIQGQDWFYNVQHEALLANAVLNVVHENRDAALNERSALEQVEKLQRSNRNGCFLEENGSEYVLNAMQTVADFERLTGFNLLLSYLLHAFGGPGAEPSDPSEMLHRLSGVYHYPYGSFILHRTDSHITSFSWRNHVMAITLPEKGIWSFTPLYTNYTGIVKPADDNDPYIRDTERCNLQPASDGFAAVGSAARAGRKLMQDIAFVSLPDGRSVYVEQFRAIQSCLAEDIQTGMIGIRNERYTALPDVAPGHWTLYFPEGFDRFEGFYGGAPNVIRTYPAQPYLNVNNEMGYLLFGSQGMKVVNQHEYPKWKGLEDILILNDSGRVEFQQNDQLPPFIVVSIPNQTVEETVRSAQSTTLLCCTTERLVVLETEDCLVYAQFNDTNQTVQASKTLDGFSTGTRITLYPGNNRMDNNRFTWSGMLPAFQSGYWNGEHQAELSFTEGVCLDFSVLADRIIVVNSSAIPAEFSLHNKKNGCLNKFELAEASHIVIPVHYGEGSGDQS